MRVPTYATYMRMTNDTIANKKLVDLYSYQSITGLKAQTYSGYGMSASTIVSLEAMLGVTNNFMENNKITEVEIKTMNTSMESIQDAINDFKKALTHAADNEEAQCSTPDKSVSTHRLPAVWQSSAMH